MMAMHYIAPFFGSFGFISLLHFSARVSPFPSHSRVHPHLARAYTFSLPLARAALFLPHSTCNCPSTLSISRLPIPQCASPRCRENNGRAKSSTRNRYSLQALLPTLRRIECRDDSSVRRASKGSRLAASTLPFARALFRRRTDCEFSFWSLLR